jgi:hypothetical protein
MLAICLGVCCQHIFLFSRKKRAKRIACKEPNGSFREAKPCPVALQRVFDCKDAEECRIVMNNVGFCGRNEMGFV